MSFAGNQYTSDEGYDLDTKGQIHSYDTANAALNVGSNNQTILADSAQALGLKYAASSTSTLTTTGDLLAASAANVLTRIGAGASGEVLTGNGTGVLPTFQAAGGGALWEQAYQTTITDNVFDTGTVTFKKYIQAYLSWSEFDLGGNTNYKQELQFNDSDTAEYTSRYFCNANAGTRTGQQDLNVFEACGTMSETASAGSIFISLINISGQNKYGLAQGNWIDSSSGAPCRSSVWFQWENTSLVTSIQIDPNFNDVNYKYADATLTVLHSDG